VLVQTRWHADDLAGRLLDRASGGGEPWERLIFPALAEDAGDPLGRPPGAALWPERYPRERLLEIQATVGGYWFSALYQQRPTPPEGAIFRRHWFRYWRRYDDCLLLGDHRVAWPRPALHSAASAFEHEGADWAFGVVDLAVSQRASADYTVITAWLTTAAGELVLLDLVRDRLEAPRLVPAIEELARRYQLDYVGIEKAGFQEAIIQEARRRGLAVKPLIPRGDKTSRAAAASVRFEAGSVYFPANAPWLAELEAELLAFPNAPHDDQVDCISYACLEVARRLSRTRTEPEPREDEPRPDPWE
jgi:predicted phage terminase large subunit-like protein